ncbi:hypothetical protein EV126DRAFT_421376 [Verticillium dahliae]|nr:hypothetical protein EV126DRAFT_421376 [Verticillium dahliae]
MIASCPPSRRGQCNLVAHLATTTSFRRSFPSWFSIISKSMVLVVSGRVAVRPPRLALSIPSLILFVCIRTIPHFEFQATLLTANASHVKPHLPTIFPGAPGPKALSMLSKLRQPRQATGPSIVKQAPITSDELARSTSSPRPQSTCASSIAPCHLQTGSVVEPPEGNLHLSLETLCS